MMKSMNSPKLHDYLFFLLLEREACNFKTSFSIFSGTSVPFSSKNNATDLENDDSLSASSFLLLATKNRLYLSLYL